MAGQGEAGVSKAVWLFSSTAADYFFFIVIVAFVNFVWFPH